METSLYQGVLAFTTQLWQDAEIKPEPWVEIAREPQPSIYECADGLWVHSMHMAGGRGKDRSMMWRILGIDPPPAKLDIAARAAHDGLVRQAMKRIKRQDLLDQFWANEIPIAPVRHAHEALDDEQVVNNGMSVEVADPIHGLIRQAGISFRLHGAPPPSVQGRRSRRSASTAVMCCGRSPMGAEREPGRPGHAKRPLAHALEGIKVLDLGNFLAGPFGPMLLGDLGATVYKLESPEGDQMRPVTQPFNGCQRGKLDVVVDLKTPEGLEIAHRLIRAVDVVHHNMRPGVAERLGVDYADRQAAESVHHLLPHHDVGQRRAPRHLARLRSAGPVVVRARDGAGRRGQPAQLVSLRHVRPGLRHPIGTGGPHGAVLA